RRTTRVLSDRNVGASCPIALAHHQFAAQRSRSVMRTQEIPRQEWKSFFDSFSRQHEGWLATLEVLGSDVGAQEEAHELPLEGVSVASEAGKSKSIAINMGKT